MFAWFQLCTEVSRMDIEDISHAFEPGEVCYIVLAIAKTHQACVPYSASMYEPAYVNGKAP